MSNADLIEMHLYRMLMDTEQWGTVTWGAVMGYCIGYYDTITLDHVNAIVKLQEVGGILK